MSLSKSLYNKQLRKQKRQAKAFPDFARVNSILVLFESDKAEANLEIQKILRQLFHEGKSVDAIGYLPKRESITAKSEHYRIFDKNDFSLLWKPNKAIREQLQKRHYDLLIDLTLRPILPLQYIALMADAGFKTGRQTEAPYLYDFMIQLQGTEDARYLYEQIRYYLEQIKTQDI